MKKWLICFGHGVRKIQGLQMTCVACQGTGTVPVALRVALEHIASGSPAMHANNDVDHHCAQCAAYIDEAREVLGWAKLPAPPRTPA